jgi:hypothetical protein
MQRIFNQEQFGFAYYHTIDKSTGIPLVVEIHSEAVEVSWPLREALDRLPELWQCLQSELASRGLFLQVRQLSEIFLLQAARQVNLETVEHTKSALLILRRPLGRENYPGTHIKMADLSQPPHDAWLAAQEYDLYTMPPPWCSPAWSVTLRGQPTRMYQRRPAVKYLVEGQVVSF